MADLTLTVGIAFKLTDDEFAAVGWLATRVDVNHPVVRDIVERLLAMPAVLDVVVDDVLLTVEGDQPS